MIKRLGFAVPAMFIAVAVTMASSPVEAAGTRTVRLGVSQTDGSRDIQAVHNFANSVGGHYPASWTLWSTWGNPHTKAFPTAMVQELKNIGVTPMIWWEPMKQEQGSCAFAKHRVIARGSFDKYIKNWARAAKASKTTILLRYSHEINGSYFPWTVGRCGNTIKSYKASWKRVYNLVRNKVGAKNVKFVWTVAKKKSPRGGNAYKAYYPGHKYVQYAGFSTFNWGTPKTTTWVTMEKAVGLVLNKLQQFTPKPVIVAELASNKDGGPNGVKDDKADWIRNGYEAVYAKYPRVKGIVWLNVDLTRVGHPDWSLNSPNPQARQAYEEIVSKAKFKGHY